MPLEQHDPSVVQDAVFGRQVELFLETDIGRYLVKKANEEIAAALDDLKSVDPTVPFKVMLAQNRVRVAETVMGWLGDAIVEGQAAREIIEGE